MNASSLQILRTLIAKDWRLFRVPMIALIISAVGVYLIAETAIIEDAWKVRSDRYPLRTLQVGVNANGQWMAALQDLVKGSIGGICLTGFLCCALGGVAIAGERAERSGDFIGLLPVTRRQIILSKWITSLLMVSLFTVVHLLFGATCMALHRWIHGGNSTPGGIALEPLAQGAIWWIGTTACLFGVGWLFSVFLNSGPISACISIAVMAIAMVVTALQIDRHHPKEWEGLLISAVVGLMIGISSLIGGAVYYLKRIAP